MNLSMENIANFLLGGKIEEHKIVDYRKRVFVVLFFITTILVYLTYLCFAIVDRNIFGIVINGLVASVSLVLLQIIHKNKMDTYYFKTLICILMFGFLFSFYLDSWGVVSHMRMLFIPLLIFSYFDTKKMNVVFILYTIIIIIIQLRVNLIAFDSFLNFICAYGIISFFSCVLRIMSEKTHFIFDRVIKEKEGIDIQTGIFNKTAMYQAAERLVREEKEFSIMMLDIDNFKNINDKLGHQKGDEFIEEIVRIMNATIDADDLTGRFGGDEFVIIKMIKSKEDTINYMMKITEEVARGKKFPMTISIGAINYDGVTKDFEKLFYHADEALYYTKAVGKNGYTLYNDLEEVEYKSPLLENRKIQENISEFELAKTIDYCSDLLLKEEKMYENLSLILQTIGEKFEALQVYYYYFDEVGDMICDHQWKDKNSEKFCKDLKKIERNHVENFCDKLKSGENIFIPIRVEEEVVAFYGVFFGDGKLLTEQIKTTSAILGKLLSLSVSKFRQNHVDQRAIEVNGNLDVCQADYLIDKNTGCYNLNYLEKYLEILKGKKEDEEVFISFSYLNIDGFRKINEAYGYEKGDLFLKKFSKIVKSMLVEDEMLFRIAGDDFLVITTTKDEEQFMPNKIFERHEKSIYKKVEIEGEEMNFSSTMGVSCYPKDSDNLEELIRYAEIAMISAKKTNKGTIKLFEDWMYKKKKYKMDVVEDVKNSKIGEFEMYYQPVFDVKSQRIEEVEALMRWNHPEKGLLSPYYFIDVVEESGQIIDLDKLMFEQILLDIKKWKDDYGISMTVSYNVSSSQLKIGNYAKELIKKIENHGLSTDCIVIEIAEYMIIDDSDAIKENLRLLRKNNIRIALDDFGMKYSTLSQLDKLEYDILKIDLYFTRNYDKPIPQFIIEMISKIVKNDKKTCIVEGVESIEEIEEMKNYDFSKMQGYYYYKPMNVEKMTEELIKQKDRSQK